jgi:hypothetical protein
MYEQTQESISSLKAFSDDIKTYIVTKSTCRKSKYGFMKDASM